MCQLPYKESVVLQWRNVAPLNNMWGQSWEFKSVNIWIENDFEPHILGRNKITGSYINCVKSENG